MAVQYFSTDQYIGSTTNIRLRITRIDAIIDALILQTIDEATNEPLKEYSLDDGQTKITCMYRSGAEITKSIEALERVKQLYVNRLSGRTFKLVDEKNLPGRR